MSTSQIMIECDIKSHAHATIIGVLSIQKVDLKETFRNQILPCSPYSYEDNIMNF